MIVYPQDANEIHDGMSRLKDAQSSACVTPNDIVDVLDAWGKRLANAPLVNEPGLVFLTHWLRRATLTSLLQREIGSAAIHGRWQCEGSIHLRRVPVGVVGHWPAANVIVQPLLSMTCAALGGNASAIRIPSGLEAITEDSLSLLAEVDSDRLLSDRVCCFAFASDRRELLEAMASHADGAMIWGGEEAVLSVRSLPFPHSTRFSIFGPRNSLALIDRSAWRDPAQRVQWCKRLARDVWQFEQRACSSPQVLYVERDPSRSIDVLLHDLEIAFREENRLHSRAELAAFHATSVVRARAKWLIDDESRQARFPAEPDWTILAGEGTAYPTAVQNRCLFVQTVDDLCEPLRQFNGEIQTVGLGCGDAATEHAVVEEALRRGVDRVTWLGRMHVFDSPWDGTELVAPMTRLVRYTPLQREEAAA